MQYKKHEVTVSYDGHFICRDFDLEDETYKGLCAKIDKASKKKYAPVKAFVGYNADNLEIVTATSPHGDNGAWITDSKGKRKAQYLSNLIVWTPKNEITAVAAQKKIHELKTQICEQETLIDALPRVVLMEQVDD